MTHEIIWDEDIILGLKEIDAQHEHLAVLLNRVVRKYQRMEERDHLKRLLNFIYEYVVWHFVSEEGLMKLYKYPEIKNHEEDHHALLKMLKDKISFFENSKGWPAGLDAFLVTWFGGHNFGNDREMAKYINSERELTE